MNAVDLVEFSAYPWVLVPKGENLENVRLKPGAVYNYNQLGSAPAPVFVPGRTLWLVVLDLIEGQA